MSRADLTADIAELQFLLSQSKRASNRALLEREEIRLNGLISTMPAAKPAASANKVTKKTCPTKKVTNYGWDETNTMVKIYITGIKDESVIVEKDNIESTFETRSVNLFLRDVKGKNYSLQVLNLYNDIIPDSSSVRITKTGATISMKKAESGKWNNLKVSHEKKEDVPKPDKNADPQAGMMDMMKKMYDEGDDDMKKQIAKSMYESQQKQKGGDEGAMPDMSGMPGMEGMGGMGGMPGMGGMGGMGGGAGGAGGAGGMAGMEELLKGMQGGAGGAGGMAGMEELMKGMGGGAGGAGGMAGMPDIASMMAGMGGKK